MTASDPRFAEEWSRPDVSATQSSRFGGGEIEVCYRAVGKRTAAARVRESGSLRLRQLRGEACHGVLVNTAGGIVAGDRLRLAVTLEPAAAALVTTAAAEKVYRSADAAARVETRLGLAADSRLLWLPQETILFDAGRLRRSFDVDLAETAELVAIELLVLGRRAHGEDDVTGLLHDSWRVRRGGRLAFADETRLEGAIGRRLARGAVAGGQHAVALLLVAGPRAAAALEPMRASVESAGRGDGEGGVSSRDGIIVARLLAPSAQRLRAMVAEALAAIGVSLPRAWH